MTTLPALFELPHPYQWTEGTSSGGWNIMVGVNQTAPTDYRLFIQDIETHEIFRADNAAWFMQATDGLKEIRRQLERGTFEPEAWIIPPPEPMPEGWGRF